VEKCEPGMQKCGACNCMWTCVDSPYLTKRDEAREQDWSGYNFIRGGMCRLPEEKYLEMYELLCFKYDGYEEATKDIPKHIMDQLNFTRMKEAVMGLERIHRMLLKMKEEGAFTVPEEMEDRPLTLYTLPETLESPETGNGPDKTHTEDGRLTEGNHNSDGG